MVTRGENRVAAQPGAYDGAKTGHRFHRQIDIPVDQAEADGDGQYSDENGMIDDVDIVADADETGDGDRK